MMECTRRCVDAINLRYMFCLRTFRMKIFHFDGSLARLFIFFISWQRDSKLYDPPRSKQGARKRDVPPCFRCLYLLLCKSLHAAWHLDSTLGQRYEPSFKKGKSDTEAHQDDLAADSSFSKHLARTLFWSPVLYIHLSVLACGCGKKKNMAKLGSKSDLSKCLKSIFNTQTEEAAKQDDREHLESKYTVGKCVFRHQQLMESVIN